MPQITIRQSGGANIVSLPKSIIESLGLGVGSTLDVSIENNKIVLSPSETAATLEWLLEGSPVEKLTLNEEDREWLDSSSRGNELIRAISPSGATSSGLILIQVVDIKS